MVELEIFSEDEGKQFTLTEFKQECQTRGFHLMLVAPEDQEMNRQVEVTWRMLRTISHYLIVHARVLEVYFLFKLMNTKYHISPFIQIKDMIN